MCTTCNNPAMAAAMAIQTDYANNAAGRLYQPYFNQPVRSAIAAQNFKADDPLILTAGPGYRYSIPGAPCLQLQPAIAPLNAAFKQHARAPRVNVDGKLVKSDLCYYACANSGNEFINPVPYAPTTNYVLPGGVISAVKAFVQCGPAPP